ncbi:geranylgeranyl diphosphate reductase, chloroplastic [Phalaenopsis equestris]|uniref:geranylgeranyl diphosphate reductase, chloroplastic n=1 Tax=Phalaenopsis equestris TaxID=78828 RepID=UPI0009E30436|nr:geranylgeranyl diphosphate reductase, chloroplastic [Phalaenopsis equestris]
MNQAKHLRKKWNKFRFSEAKNFDIFPYYSSIIYIPNLILNHQRPLDPPQTNGSPNLILSHLILRPNPYSKTPSPPYLTPALPRNGRHILSNGRRPELRFPRPPPHLQELLRSQFRPIPPALCLVGGVDLPLDIIDRRVTKMKMISPSNVAVDIGRTLKPHEYIGMVRREVLDAYLRDRAAEAGATVVNGLFLKMDCPPAGSREKYKLYYNDYSSKKSSTGEKKEMEVDAVVGADGANSRVAKEIGAGDYEYAIAFQERVKIPEDKMNYYKERAEMYVGDDVSPDFYGWVFPKCDHVAVGTGTVTHKSDIKRFQAATRLRARDKIAGGKIIRIEAHPIPEHPRPRRVLDRVALVGDAAGYVTKCSGEGIYFAAKSGRMCAEAIVEGSANGTRMIEEGDLRNYLQKFDKMYWPTYKVLDILQKVFYRSNSAREAFVEMCADDYVQKMTFDSYLYKQVVPGNPLDDLRLAINTIGSLVRAGALRREMAKITA